MDVADWLRTLDLSHTRRHSGRITSLILVPSLPSEGLKVPWALHLSGTAVGYWTPLLYCALNADLARDPQAASADHLRQPLQSAAERRNISVMFCDMAGYTSLSSHTWTPKIERSDPRLSGLRGQGDRAFPRVHRALCG